MTKIDETIDKLRQLRLLCMAEHLNETLEGETNHA